MKRVSREMKKSAILLFANTRLYGWLRDYMAGYMTIWLVLRATNERIYDKDIVEYLILASKILSERLQILSVKILDMLVV